MSCVVIQKPFPALYQLSRRSHYTRKVQQFLQCTEIISSNLHQATTKPVMYIEICQYQQQNGIIHDCGMIAPLKATSISSLWVLLSSLYFIQGFGHAFDRLHINKESAANKTFLKKMLHTKILSRSAGLIQQMIQEFNSADSESNDVKCSVFAG